jgi:hypothetical protein
MEEVKKIRANAASESMTVPAAQLATIREQLKQELLAELRGEIKDEMGNEIKETQPQNNGAPEEAPPASSNDKVFNKHGLIRMKEGNLSNVLASRGIATDGMNKADMIEAILKSNPKTVEEVA